MKRKKTKTLIESPVREKRKKTTASSLEGLTQYTEDLKENEVVKISKKKKEKIDIQNGVINERQTAEEPVIVEKKSRKRTKNNKPQQEAVDGTDVPETVIKTKKIALEVEVPKKISKKAKRRMEEATKIKKPTSPDPVAQLPPITPKKTKKPAKEKGSVNNFKQEIYNDAPEYKVEELTKIKKTVISPNPVSEMTSSTFKKTKRTPKDQTTVNNVKQEAYVDNSLHFQDNIKIEEDLDEVIGAGFNESSHSDNDTDLEVFNNYMNTKSSEKEAKEKTAPKRDPLSYWSKEDQLTLVQRIEGCIPKDDSLNYRVRLGKTDWSSVPFKNYTLEECQKVWLRLEKKVRHYRLLIEVIQDVKLAIEVDNDKAKRKGKTQKTKRHPDMPKRPLSSYFLFYIRKKDKVAQENPNLDTIEINRLVSEKYSKIPPEKKEKYDKLALKNKEEYQKKLEIFYATHPEVPRKASGKKAKIPKPVKEKPPSRPENPYKQFLLAEYNREKIDDNDKAEFKEVCREKWRQMSDKKKLVWINYAEDKMSKYQEELKEYITRHPEYNLKPPSKPFLTREEVNLKEKLAGKPKKPPGNVYSLFVSLMLQSEEISSIPAKERMNYTSTKWKVMQEEEKERYKVLLADMTEQYNKNFKAYLDTLPEDLRQKEILLNMPKKRKLSEKEKPSTSTKASPKAKEKNKIVEPIQPPRSVFKYFARRYTGEEKIKDAWKNLPAQTKRQYEKELCQLKQNYIKEFERFLKSLTKEELETFSASRVLIKSESDSNESESSEGESSGNGSESDNESSEESDDA